MRQWLRAKPVTARVTAGFVCAMLFLLLGTGAFIYERMRFALDRSIADVPSAQRAEIDARKRHRDEALNELLLQLTVAFGGALVVAGYVGYRTTRAALRPVERMRMEAVLRSGELAFRLPVPDTQDELSRLATTLNGLLARLEESAAHERRLVADASHELRTPLAHMQMEIDLALNRERSREELVAALERLRDETRRLTRLANDLLFLARAREGQLRLRLEPLDLRAVAEQARDRFVLAGVASGRSIELSLVPVPPVRADPDRVGQALGNLIDNALRYGAGPITIKTSPCPGGGVAIHVLDEGPGFPNAFLGRAFDRFATASASRSDGAVGLGLAIVDAIVRAHGGRAGVKNREGRGGADVWIELPSSMVEPGSGQAPPQTVFARSSKLTARCATPS